MTTPEHHTFTDFGRRICLTLTGMTCMSALLGCKTQDSGPPKPPYGKALDVTQANTFVEFDIRIQKNAPHNRLGLYDVVLEIFKKERHERVPDEVWEIPNAHFKVSIQSLGASGEMIVEREVIGNKGRDGLWGAGFGPSRSEKTDLMSMAPFLIYEQSLSEGTYRIRCENLNPLPSLDGRLVKVIVESSYLGK